MKLKTKIVIIEDFKLFRDGLRAILEKRDDFQIIGEASDGVEALSVIRITKPDLLLLDLSMPRLDGISVIKDALLMDPDLKILVITMRKSDQIVLETLRAGANGFCHKDSSGNEFLEAIDMVLEGKTFISQNIDIKVVQGSMIGLAEIKTKSTWEKVTQREREILKLIAEGFMNKEIASILNISIKTVEGHRTNLMNKLNIHNVAALTSFAINKNLV